MIYGGIMMTRFDDPEWTPSFVDRTLEILTYLTIQVLNFPAILLTKIKLLSDSFDYLFVINWVTYELLALLLYVYILRVINDKKRQKDKQLRSK